MRLADDRRGRVPFAVVGVLLLVRAHVAPSSTTRPTGSTLEDFYFGLESYPYYKTINVKQFLNCRVGMMLWPIVVNRSADKFTLGPGLALLRGEFITDWNVVMAAGVMAALPMILIFLLLQKQFIASLARSGLK